MKIFKRSATLATLAIFVSQLFFSCSTSQQIGKNQAETNDLNIAQLSAPATSQSMENVAVANATVENAAKKEVAEASKQVILAYSKAETPIINTKGNSAKVMFTQIEKADVKADKKAVRSILKNVKNITGLASPASPMGDNQIVALVLCILLGGLGIHRYYLGYIWQGIVQSALFLLGFLTFGIAWIPLYIWVVVDFVRILLGTLEPKDGSYSDTILD